MYNALVHHVIFAAHLCSGAPGPACEYTGLAVKPLTPPALPAPYAGLSCTLWRRRELAWVDFAARDASGTVGAGGCSILHVCVCVNVCVCLSQLCSKGCLWDWRGWGCSIPRVCACVRACKCVCLSVCA